MNIEKHALRLAELNQRYKESLAAGKLLHDDDIGSFLDLISEKGQLWKEISDELMRNSTYVVKDPVARATIEEMGLPDAEALHDDDCEELLWNWLSPRDYAVGLAQVNALIAPVKVPTLLKQFVEEARQCYALQQPNAVFSLSRTILETSINDICVRIGKIPRRVLDEDDFKDYSFPYRLSILASGSRFEQIRDCYKLLCRTVHGTTAVTLNEALATLLEVITYVSQLYLVYQHSFRKNR
jgi:hypothetical protein